MEGGPHDPGRESGTGSVCPDSNAGLCGYGDGTTELGNKSAIDEIRRGFLWRGRKEARGGHCLISWPKVCRHLELGGLGISDLKRLNCTLRARWPWLRKTEPNKPWANLPIQVSKDVECLISMAVITEVGDGTNTLFWKDRWLDGHSIQELAPRVFALVSNRRANKRTVREALTNEKWLEDIQGAILVEGLLEFLEVWDLISLVELQVGTPDKHIWRLSNSGEYSAKSAYEVLFQGVILFRPAERI